MLSISNVSKSYGGNQILDGLSFNIHDGDIYGFLGPNGAGKSTTINILSTIVDADRGSITYQGNSIINNKVYKTELGIVPQEIALYENMTALDNVLFFSQFYIKNTAERKRRANEALERVGLLAHASELPCNFSGGMKRRLNIACSIAHNPKLLILDEPTVGVDPQSRNKIMDVLKELNKGGTTILYTSHYMEEVEVLCNRVAIIDQGRILKEGLLRELMNDEEIVYEITGKGFNQRLIDMLKRLLCVKNVVLNESLLVTTSCDDKSFGEIVNILMKHSCMITGVHRESRNLEKIFLNLTGKKLRD